MSVVIRAEDLSEETREKLGIRLEPELGAVGNNLVRLGKVIQALKGLSDEEAMSLLHDAARLVRNRQSASGDSFAPHREQPYVPPIHWVVQCTAKVFSLRPEDIKQRRRTYPISEARQVCMYLLVLSSGYTLEEIGKGLGGRSPATVSHGFQTVARKLESGVSELQSLVDEIRLML